MCDITQIEEKALNALAIILSREEQQLTLSELLTAINKKEFPLVIAFPSTADNFYDNDYVKNISVTSEEAERFITTLRELLINRNNIITPRGTSYWAVSRKSIKLGEYYFDLILLAKVTKDGQYEYSFEICSLGKAIES